MGASFEFRLSVQFIACPTVPIFRSTRCTSATSKRRWIDWFEKHFTASESNE